MINELHTRRVRALGVPHHRKFFDRSSFHRFRRWLLFFSVCLPLFWVLAPNPGHAGGSDSPCNLLGREKYLWHSLFEDFIPPFFGTERVEVPDASFRSCWACGLWAQEAWHASWHPPSLQRPLTIQKAGCYRLLEMEEAALGACRRLLAHDPIGDEAGPCIQTIIEVLFHAGNLESAVSFYEGLNPSQQNLASPESLYLLGESCHLLHRDPQASTWLEQVPSDSEVFPLALYSRVQIAFRSGQVEQAETLLQSFLRADVPAHVPDVILEQARLTLARILFQQQRYEEAADVFRQMNRSRYFLPEALIGMGWSYEGLGRLAGAISFFEAAQEAASLDFLLRSKAELETARLYAESGLHADAFRILQDVQTRIREYILFLTRVPQDPAWIAGQMQLLPLPQAEASAVAPPEEPVPNLDPDAVLRRTPPSEAEDPDALPVPDPAFQEEITAVLQKESFVSARMQELHAIRDALRQVQSLLDLPPAAERTFPMKRGISTRPTPPLETRDTLLEPEVISLLDAALALLDTEYRLDQATGSLGLSGPQERSEFFRDSLTFYRLALPALILETPQDPEESNRTLTRIMGVVRYLPYPLEDRARVMQKLVHTQQALQDGEQTLRGWAQSMEEAGAGVVLPPRPLFLRLWMIYVRSLIYLRSWEDRSPSVFLLPTLTAGSPPVPEPLSAPDARRDLLTARIAEVRQRLGDALQKEILRFCADRLSAFEKLLMDSELYYAEALLKHQKFLMKELQSLPPDVEDKETQEGPPAAPSSPEPSADET